MTKPPRDRTRLVGQIGRVVALRAGVPIRWELDFGGCSDAEEREQ